MNIKNLFLCLAILASSLRADEPDPFAPTEIPTGDQAEVVATPAPPADEAGIEKEVPVIGTVIMQPTPADAPIQGLQAKLADKNRKLVLGPLTLDDATLVLADSGKLSMTARGNLFGNQVRVGIKEYTSERIVFAIMATKPLQPFAKVPGLSQITLTETFLSYTKKIVSVGGMVRILGGDFTAEFKEGYLIVTLPTVPPDLKGTFIEAIKPTDLYAVITRADFTDQETKTKYVSGINLGGTLNFSGQLKALGDMAGKSGESEQFVVALPMPLDPRKLFINIKIPTKVPVSDTFALQSVIFSLGGVPFQMKLAGTSLWKPSPKDPDMTFAIQGAFDAVPAAVCFELAGSYEGNWNNAMGITGLDLQKLGLAFGGCAVPPPVFVTPKSFGIACGMQIGGRELDVAVKGDLIESKYGFYGKLKPTDEELKAGRKAALSIVDLINFAQKYTKKPIDRSKIPTIELENFEMRAAAAPIDIANIHYDAGMLFKTEFNLFGVRAHVDIRGQETGLYGTGYIDKVTNGAFSLTGAGQTGGPLVIVDLGVPPKFVINGDMRLGTGVKWSTNIDVSATDATLEVEQIFKLGDAQMHLYVKGLARSVSTKGPPDFYLKANFDNQLYDWLYAKLQKELSQAAAEADRKFGDAIRKIDQLESDIAATKKEIKDRQDWLNTEGKKVKNVFESTKKSFEITGLGTKLAGLLTAQKTAEGVVSGVGEISSKLLRNLPEVVKTLQVRKIEFEGSAREMVDGVFPKGNVEVMIAGKTITLKDAVFDVAKPAHALENIANSIVKEIFK